MLKTIRSSFNQTLMCRFVPLAKGDSRRSRQGVYAPKFYISSRSIVLSFCHALDGWSRAPSTHLPIYPSTSLILVLDSWFLILCFSVSSFLRSSVSLSPAVCGQQSDHASSAFFFVLWSLFFGLVFFLTLSDSDNQIRTGSCNTISNRKKSQIPESGTMENNNRL
jgi:hypothetical protein